MPPNIESVLTVHNMSCGSVAWPTGMVTQVRLISADDKCFIHSDIETQHHSTIDCQNVIARTGNNISCQLHTGCTDHSSQTLTYSKTETWYYDMIHYTTASDWGNVKYPGIESVLILLFPGQLTFLLSCSNFDFTWSLFKWSLIFCTWTFDIHYCFVADKTIVAYTHNAVSAELTKYTVSKSLVQSLKQLVLTLTTDLVSLINCFLVSNSP